MSRLVVDFSLFLIICIIYSYINGVNVSIGDEIIRKLLWTYTCVIMYIHLCTYAGLLLLAAIIIHLNDDSY